MNTTRAKAMRDIVQANRLFRSDDDIRSRLTAILRPEDTEGLALLEQALSEEES